MSVCANEIWINNEITGNLNKYDSTRGQGKAVGGHQVVVEGIHISILNYFRDWLWQRIFASSKWNVIQMKKKWNRIKCAVLTILGSPSVLTWLLYDKICTKVVRYERTKSIPHNCHFFYTGKIFGEYNLHRKTPIFRVKSVKNATFSRKICRKCQFFALNL